MHRKTVAQRVCRIIYVLRVIPICILIKITDTTDMQWIGLYDRRMSDRLNPLHRRALPLSSVAAFTVAYGLLQALYARWVIASAFWADRSWG